MVANNNTTYQHVQTKANRIPDHHICKENDASIQTFDGRLKLSPLPSFPPLGEEQNISIPQRQGVLLTG